MVINTSVLMIMNRNVTLASTLGHIINFHKDEPVAVPAILVKEAAGMGAVPVDGSDPHAEPVSNEPAQPVSPSDRLVAIREVIDLMVETNMREDFTASGTPKLSQVSDAVGFKVDRTEVARAWKDRSLELADES